MQAVVISKGSDPRFKSGILIKKSVLVGLLVLENWLIMLRRVILVGSYQWLKNKNPDLLEIFY